MNESSGLMRTTNVPNWMIQIAIWLLGSLALGASATIGALVWWAVGIEGRVSYLEVRQEQEVLLLAGVAKDIKEISAAVHAVERKVDVIDSRLNRTPPCD